ncbi:transposase [Streptomyces sp. PRh5]|uniref:IS481 family transposase n=1 Tax=Streptomyces sp. PRh5 TaxID=1158056 RepID=UPI00044E8D7C|nr:IS481 family transposase [Streptomyces sp. PRh5]EXU69804.1 transposase [Streptomyces sp. PRh5]
MPHPNARLTVHGRRLLIERVRAGRPVAHVADEMGISRTTAHKWVRRWRAEGDAGLYDRSSRPLTTPHRTPADVENRICELRRERKLGPARIGPILEMPASTVHRVLTRHQLNRLRWMDRPTGQVIRRYERGRPGELVHVDIKKLGNIPDGGGHRIMTRQQATGNRQATTDARQGGSPVIGYSFVHTHSHRRPHPARLQRDPDRAYVRPYSSNAERAEALADFLHTYNYHRCHTALGGQPPISRVNNPASQYS